MNGSSDAGLVVVVPSCLRLAEGNHHAVARAASSLIYGLADARGIITVARRPR